MPEQTPAQIDSKKLRFKEFSQSQDAWTMAEIAAMPIAQFYIEKTNANKHKLITDAEYRRFLKGQQTPQGQAVAEAFTIGLKKRFFHWFLEFPEIMARGGFDCILGNPPYLGGQKLSSTYGYPFCTYSRWEFSPAGLSDLVVFFVRRIYSLLSSGGFTAFITTNSIKDGDIRKDGLEQILSQGGNINMAVRGLKWPGRANLVVSLVALHKGGWSGAKLLDGKAVLDINAYFEDTFDIGNPIAINENRERLFQGSIFLGEGFFLTNEHAQLLRDTNARNAEVIFPTLNGQDVNNIPDQSPPRSVINFFDWPIEKAREYPEPFSIIADLVQPFRAKQNRERNRDYWWIYAEHRPGLNRNLVGLKKCMVASLVTKHLSFSMVLSQDWVTRHGQGRLLVTAII